MTNNLTNIASEPRISRDISPEEKKEWLELARPQQAYETQTDKAMQAKELRLYSDELVNKGVKISDIMTIFSDYKRELERNDRELMREITIAHSNHPYNFDGIVRCSSF